MTSSKETYRNKHDDSGPDDPGLETVETYSDLEELANEMEEDRLSLLKAVYSEFNDARKILKES